MLKLYQENKLFFTLSFLFAFVGGIILLLTEKGEVEIFVNKYSSTSFDYLFYYATYLGDGRVITVFLFLLLFIRVYYALAGGIIFAISSAITQAMKRLIFYDFPRPSKFFDPGVGLRFIEGLELHSWFSFPSGHASGAFTILFFVSLISKKPVVQGVCFVLALLAAFSRVYLLQHFFLDIYAGALIGIFITAVLYYFIQYKSDLPSNTKLNLPLLRLLR